MQGVIGVFSSLFFLKLCTGNNHRPNEIQKASVWFINIFILAWLGGYLQRKI